MNGEPGLTRLGMRNMRVALPSLLSFQEQHNVDCVLEPLQRAPVLALAEMRQSNQHLDHVRSVDAGHCLTILHMAAGLVDLELPDETVGARRDRQQRAFIRLGHLGCLDWPLEAVHSYRLQAHIGVLQFGDADLGRAEFILPTIVDGDAAHSYPFPLFDTGEISGIPIGLR